MPKWEKTEKVQKRLCMELISVVMSVYNEKPMWLRKSIESILNQTYSNIEYIIILDNSDNVELENIIKEYSQKDNRIRFLKNVSNQGLVYSLNKGIREAKGQYIARMDADDYSIKERLEQQYSCLIKNDVDFVMSNVDFLYDEKFVPGSQISDLNSNQFVYMLQFGDVSIHPTWFFKREVYDNVGGYREISYCEDLDFLLRAVQRGYKCFKMKERLLFYRLRQNGITKSNGLEQFTKARILRQAYRREESIDTITPLYLKKCCEKIKNGDKIEFSKANGEIDQFVKALNERKLMKAFANFCCGILKSKYYRILFFQAVNYRLKLVLCVKGIV